MAFPSLISLCLRTICEGNDVMQLNLDNVLDVLHFGRKHHFVPLIERAEAFVRSAYQGVRARHACDDVMEVLGTELFNELEKEANAAEAALRKIKLMGTVLEGPAVEATMTVGAA